ncbi:MAG TPA: cytochrome c [Bryobacteraceae bacterium]|nr:cytochrome c [Bryobacteraceae bacterium]
MAKRVPFSSFAVLALLLGGCEPGPHSSSGFRLPEGNAQRGKAAFVAYGCHSCHQVSGVDLPKPTVQPPVPVVLGGVVEQPMTDGYLVTSIIYPSYKLASYPKEQITVNGQSRMPHYADKMTVQELTDIVAFLQAQYVIRRATPEYGLR